MIKKKENLKYSIGHKIPPFILYYIITSLSLSISLPSADIFFNNIEKKKCKKSFVFMTTT